MKKVICLISMLLFMIDVSAQTVKDVDAFGFQKLITSGNGVILDVRTPHEYSRGHIEGSTLINVSDQEFVNKINLLQKDKPVYIYCLTGARSASAANYMAKMGFDELYNLQRGIMNWSQNGLPIATSKVSVETTSKQYSVSDFEQLINSKSVVLIDFHAVWCAPCKNMSPIIDKLKEEFDGKAVVEKIDIEVNKTISDAYKIQSVPGFILFKEGKQIWAHKGMISHSELKGKIEGNL